MILIKTVTITILLDMTQRWAAQYGLCLVLGVYLIHQCMKKEMYFSSEMHFGLVNLNLESEQSWKSLLQLRIFI